VAGEVQMVADPLSSSLPHIQSGKLRPLAVAGPERSTKLPALPTTAEAGYPKLLAPFWLGVVAPAGTPAAIIERLNAALRESLAPEETRARISNLGAEIKIGTPAEFGQLLADELAQWISVAKSANIKVD
jgi:tripartite-type tricarboxylate transporter receptor subunit TctC